MVYLVHHTLNRNEIYTGGKRNPYPLLKTISLINRGTKRTQRLTNQHLFPFKTNGRKWDFDCTIHGIINTGKIVGAYFGRVLSFFDQKSYIMTFSENIFSNFERGILTCFIDALLRFFTILYSLKNRHHPGWSVRTLDQYICEQV